tara:strand:+ start:90 stop:323 length:234 start_codon:yes stop_codon:yes gene_type:complete
MNSFILIGLAFYVTIAICMYMTCLIVTDVLEVLKTSSIGKNRAKLDNQIAKCKSLKYLSIVWPYAMTKLIAPNVFKG